MTHADVTALVRWGEVLVSVKDALALDRDVFMNGDVYVRPTGEWRDGVPVCERIPPYEVKLA